jgi:hypothetical protein
MIDCQDEQYTVVYRGGVVPHERSNLDRQLVCTIADGEIIYCDQPPDAAPPYAPVVEL